MRALVAIGCVLGCVAPTPRGVETRPASAEAPTPRANPRELARHWVGQWQDPAEEVSFTFDIRLAPVANNAVNGRILWTLTAVRPGHFLADRVGESGTEYVVGSWDGATGELNLEGTSVDTPGFLVRDAYKLTVAKDGATFSGRTRGSLGLWKNTITGERAD